MEENENKGLILKELKEISNNNDNNLEIFTNIEDSKVIFNLESYVDNLLNDCIGQKIRIKKVLIKKWIKRLEEPLVDEETGEVIKDSKVKMCTILIDEANQSYVTGSTIFSIQLSKYIQMFGLDELEDDGLEIEIIKRKMKDSDRKCLAFRLVD